MTASRKPVESSGTIFMSVVGSKDVVDASRRVLLAEKIREARNGLRELMGIPEGDKVNRDWSLVQKEVYKRLEETTDEELRRKADIHIENLLDAEEELVEGNLRLVLMVVRRYARCQMGALEEMDFVQEGCEGLLDAVRRFDFAGGKGFLTYAVVRIKKRVLMAMEKQQRLVRIPSHVVKKSMYLKEIIEDFASRKGRFPLSREIEEETGSSIDWPLILSLSEKVIPFHAPLSDDGIPLSERIPGNAPSPEDIQLEDVLEEALSKLDERSKFVLVMRYGLMDGETQTLDSISKVLGLSIERTRQIEKNALSLLRDSFSGYSITDWLQG